MKNIIGAIAIASVASAAAAQVNRDATPQEQLVTTCNYEAKNRELSGADRDRFVSTCLSQGRKRLQEVFKACNIEAGRREGAERMKFLAECQRR